MAAEKLIASEPTPGQPSAEENGMKLTIELTEQFFMVYDGRDRVLREAIENVLIKAIGDSDMRQGWRGTLPLANEIMAHVKEVYRG